MMKTEDREPFGSSEVCPGKVICLHYFQSSVLTLILEPASYLHQFSQTIVESKRQNQSNQAVVNGRASELQQTAWSSLKTTTHPPNSVRPQPFLPPAPAQHRPAIVNGLLPFEKPKNWPSVTHQIPLQPTRLVEAEQIVFSAPQPSFTDKSDAKPPLTAPVPKRAKRSPILNFQLRTSAKDTIEPQRSYNIPPASEGTSDRLSVVQPAPPLTSSKPFSTSSPSNTLTEPPEDDAPTRVVGKISPTKAGGKLAYSEKVASRQSLYEREKKLLREELIQQEQERKLKLDHTEREQQKSIALARQRTVERNLVRQRQAALLQSQKMATKEREQEECSRLERQKAQQERNIQHYAEEIVNSIVQEHVLEVTANVLAIGFHRKWLLTRVVRHLKKICARSLRRKRLQLEEIKQSRNRKRLLARALSDLDAGESRALNKKPRPQLHRLNVEIEDALDEILSKVYVKSWTVLIVGERSF